MIWQFLLGFLVLVAASYVGTTMALRGYFGREYHRPPRENESEGRTQTDDQPQAESSSEDADLPEWVYSRENDRDE